MTDTNIPNDFNCHFDLNSGSHPSFGFNFRKSTNWIYFNTVTLYRLNTLKYVIYSDDDEEMSEVDLPEWSWWLYFDENDLQNGSYLESGTNACKYHFNCSDYKGSKTQSFNISKEEGQFISDKISKSFLKLQPQFFCGNFEMNSPTTCSIYRFDVNGMKYDHSTNSNFKKFNYSPPQKILFFPKEET